MKIVGGSYREICLEPTRDEFFGSALRAALAISRSAGSIEVVTVIAHPEQALVETLAKDFGISVSSHQRAYQVQFTYPTPLSAPTLSPKHFPKVELAESHETVLAFGMVDADWSVTGTTVVIDPQGLASLDTRVSWSATRTALVGNSSEIMAIANTLGSAQAASKSIQDRYKFDVVVVKCGALGALVVEDGQMSNIGAFPVQSIYPIGSGDVFSGVFAKCWGELGLSGAESARRASLATAVWVSRGPIQMLGPLGEVLNPELLEERVLTKAPTIYLAGPFFSIAERWLINTFREALVDLGATVISPFHDVGFGPPHEVAQLDLDLLASSDGVLAILDDLDPGTMFEIGCARAQGIPVVGFASRVAESDLTMLIGTGVPVHQDLSTAAYQAIWTAAE